MIPWVGELCKVLRLGNNCEHTLCSRGGSDPKHLGPPQGERYESFHGSRKYRITFSLESIGSHVQSFHEMVTCDVSSDNGDDPTHHLMIASEIYRLAQRLLKLIVDFTFPL